MAVEICITDRQKSVFDDDEAVPETIEREYKIITVDDSPGGTWTPSDHRQQAEQGLRADTVNCPVVDFNYGNLYRKMIEVDQVGSLIDQYTGKVTWQRWLPQDPNDPGAQEFFSGSVTRISTQQNICWQRVGAHTYPAGPEPFFKNMKLIGVRTGEDAGVDGTESSIPVMNFTIRRKYLKGSFDLDFLAFAYTFVGRPNSVAWRNFAIGEVMLLGVDGDDSDPEHDMIAYEFEARPTETNIVIPTVLPIVNWDDAGVETTITVPEKRGFDHLWVTTRKAKSGVALTKDLLLDVADEAYVDQLVPYVDINNLIT